jgi:glutamate-1-semialdehyde 2,1-aminomutase
MGVVPPSKEFVQAVNRLTQKHGAVLICDEVMTGFRVGFGGAQSLFGFEPGLTTLGKIVGGGLPVGAYGGRAEIMDHVLPAGKVFQAGTLSGNPLATAAGCATLRLLKEQPPYDELERLSARLATGLRRAAEKAGIAHTIARVGSMMTLFFHAGPISGWRQASQCDTARFARYFWSLIDRGVYMPCSQFEALFVSAAHTEADIDATIAAAEESLADS